MITWNFELSGGAPTVATPIISPSQGLSTLLMPNLLYNGGSNYLLYY